MNPHRSFAVGLALAAAIGVATFAQSHQKSASPSPGEHEAKLVTMKFTGGNAVDYVQALKKAAGDINVIIAVEAKDVLMPPVELTDASVEAALEVLNGKTSQVNDRFIKLELHANHGGNPAEQIVYAVDAKVQGRPVDERIMQRVWSVKNILDGGAKANDLLTAIQTSLDLNTEAGKPAQLKFHEATGLIIARASPNQIDAIQQVIEQMATQNPNVKKDDERMGAMKLELQKVHMENDLLKQQNHQLETELAEARKH